MSEIPFTAASFDKFCGEEKLMGVRCKQCGALQLPPRPICMKCNSREMEWVELKGKGKIASFTVIGVGPSTMLNEGYDREHPYCSGIVELEEGVWMLSNIVDCNPDDVKCEQPVEVTFEDATDEIAIPMFRLRAA